MDVYAQDIPSWALLWVCVTAVVQGPRATLSTRFAIGKTQLCRSPFCTRT